MRAFFSGPGVDNCKELPSDLGPRQGLEEPEEGRILVVEPIVMMVEDARDPTNIAPILHSHPQIHFGVFEERVAIAEDFLEIDEQRRHPERIVPVDGVTDLQKAAHVRRLAGQANDLDGVAHGQFGSVSARRRRPADGRTPGSQHSHFL